jgi:exopolysaccharide biosynthesis protein
MIMKKILLAILFTFLTVNTVLASPDIDVTYNDGIYHAVFKGDGIKRHIKFVSSENLITTSEAHKKYNSYFTINTGFFDPKTAQSMSYIVTDRQTAEDPLFSDSLVQNSYLRQNLSKIINRSEFRIVECNLGKTSYRYEIMPHKSSVDFGCSILTSAQGGPQVYPELKMEDEFFIVKDKDGNVIRESASVLHKTSRTIIGIKNNEAHVLVITDKHPMDLYEVHDLCKQLGFDRAMAFDGGSSTSMNYLNKYNVISTKGDGAGRSVKSFMIVTKEKTK